MNIFPLRGILVIQRCFGNQGSVLERRVLAILDVFWQLKEVIWQIRGDLEISADQEVFWKFNRHYIIISCLIYL